LVKALIYKALVYEINLSHLLYIIGYGDISSTT